MKKFAALIVVLVLAAGSVPVYASSTAGKEILRGILGTVLNEAVKS